MSRHRALRRASRAESDGPGSQSDRRGIGTPRRRATAGGAALAVLAGVVLAVSQGVTFASTGTAVITSAGPLTQIGNSTDLNCSVNHTGDSAGEWYGNTACGTLLATGGTLFGPADIPAGSNASPRTTWTEVSQTAVTGAGTTADPYKVVTVATAGATGLQVTQTDTYVLGQESYRNDVVVTNTGSASASGILYRAGDCYLQDSDYGYGQVDTATGAVTCAAGQTSGSRIEQMLPLTAGSKYYEDFYGSVWSVIGQQVQFPDTCQCNNQIDNGLGLSWALSLAAGASKTYSSYVTFSPLGILPLTLTKTADQSSVPAGGNDGYTITVTNTNASTVTLGSLTDALPAGFAYRAGTTTGATTTDPTISGQQLTWSSVAVPGGGSASVHFGVTVSSTPGTYTNEVSAAADGYTVAPTGPTAPVTVTPVAVNHPPVAADLSVTTPQDTAVGVTLSATDADSNPLTYAVVTGPAHGTLSGTAPTLTYTPTSGYTGADSFTFKANDGTADSNVATVSITVTPVAGNHPPVAADLSVTTPQDTAVGVTLSATDADSNPLTYAVVTGPAHGTLSGTAPTLTYTPTSGYTGADSFTFKANDGTADSNVATVSITVTPVSEVCPVTAPTLDVSVSADRRWGTNWLASRPLTTSGAGELVLAFIEADGPRAPTQKVTKVTGAGLTWTLATRSNATWGTTEVWQAYATAPVSHAKITAVLAKGSYDGSITVAAFKGAAHTVGAVAAGAGKVGAPSVTLTPAGCNSLVWAAGHDWTHNTKPVALDGQTIVHLFLDRRVHDAFWTQSVDTPTTVGTDVTVGDTGPTHDRWTLAAVEIPAAPAES